MIEPTWKQQVESAIIAAREVCREPGWLRWSQDWLSGRDRTPESARLAAERVLEYTGETIPEKLWEDAMERASESGMSPEDAWQQAEYAYAEAREEPPAVSIDAEAENVKNAANAAHRAASAAVFVSRNPIAAPLCDLAMVYARLAKGDVD